MPILNIDHIDTSVPVEVEKASCAAHMAASAGLQVAQQVERVDPKDIARALAHAYGEALGIVALSGGSEDDLYELGLTCLGARDALISQRQ